MVYIPTRDPERWSGVADIFTYTIEDADGSSLSAQLLITIAAGTVPVVQILRRAVLTRRFEAGLSARFGGLGNTEAGSTRATWTGTPRP